MTQLPELFRVSMIGVSGVGKTTFLAGLYEVLAVRTHGNFRLNPRAESLAEAAFKQGDISEIGFDRDRPSFPAGSMSSKRWSTTLQHRNIDIIDIDFLDYRGGIVTDVFSASKKSQTLPYDDALELNVFLSQIASASGILLFVDASMIWMNRNRLGAAKRWSGAEICSRMMFLCQRESLVVSSLPVAIVLTKRLSVNYLWCKMGR